VASATKTSALTAALLLGTTGGFLDAVVYLNHGHVFANAMTGNVIFLGISAVSRDWGDVARHMAPIMAFLCGVIAARRLSALPIPHSAALTLAVEIVALFAVGLVPQSFPQLWFTGTIAFVSAFQVTTFRRVGRFTYNSTFVTGNLRDVAEGWFDRFSSTDEKAREIARAKSFKLGMVCVCFLLGASAGAVVARRWPEHALWFAEPMLLVALSLILINPKHFDPNTPEAQRS
jgi:uncharacterized membrane protein YoaK (UPF0700 family)